MVTAQERLYWYCQLVMHGHSSADAKMILDEAIEKLENEKNHICYMCGKSKTKNECKCKDEDSIDEVY